jgi:hypothetical protein
MGTTSFAFFLEVNVLAFSPLGSLWLLLKQQYYIAVLVASSPLGSLWLLIEQ